MENLLCKQDLLDCFKQSFIDCIPFIGVVVQNSDSEKPELIMNPYENFRDKSKYYDMAYNDDLTLKACSIIRIVGWSAGSFEDVAHDYVSRFCDYCD